MSLARVSTRGWWSKFKFRGFAISSFVAHPVLRDAKQQTGTLLCRIHGEPWCVFGETPNTAGGTPALPLNWLGPRRFPLIGVGFYRATGTSAPRVACATSGLRAHCLSNFRDAKSRCRPGPHRPGRGGSTPPSCRDRVASIAAMQRSLKPQSTGQHRGDPPSFAWNHVVRGFQAKDVLHRLCEGGLFIAVVPSYGWQAISDIGPAMNVISRIFAD
jgi:hypothetical protein